MSDVQPPHAHDQVVPNDIKSAALLAYDTAIMSTVARYNLDKPGDRQRSATDLVRFFFELADLIGVDLFVEAGAKDASASRRARKQYPDLRVVAFEANPYTYETFRADNEQAKVEYVNKALTDTPGPVTFHVHKDEHGKPIANGQASLLQRNKTYADRERGFHEVTVDGVPLDEYFRDEAFRNAAVWIDVEGACQFVLPGAREMLRKTAVLIIEVEDMAYWGTDHWLREEVVSYIYDLGLVPVARDFEFVHPTSGQYNIVFVRADLLAGPTKLRSAIARFRSRAYLPAPAPKPKVAIAPQPAPSPVYTQLRRRAGRWKRAIDQRLR